MSRATYLVPLLLLFLSVATNTDVDHGSPRRQIQTLFKDILSTAPQTPRVDWKETRTEHVITPTIPRTETTTTTWCGRKRDSDGARADWKETPKEHVITLDLPGMKNKDVKIEVDENRVLSVSGERKIEDEEVEGEKCHSVERTSVKLWREFQLPGNADLENVTAKLEDGVLRITVKKVLKEKKRQPKIIDIHQKDVAGGGGEDVKATSCGYCGRDCCNCGGCGYGRRCDVDCGYCGVN